MAETKITPLTELTTPAADDLLLIVDASEAVESNKTKKIKYANLGKWASWTPSSYTGWTALPTGTYMYCIIGKLLIFNIDMSAGTSNGTSAKIKLPLTVANNQNFGGACGLAYDNGVLLTGAARWYVQKNTSEVVFQKDMGTGAWTASGTKLIRCIGFAEV
jgi:hypothetical protein